MESPKPKEPYQKAVNVFKAYENKRVQHHTMAYAYVKTNPKYVSLAAMEDAKLRDALSKEKQERVALNKNETSVEDDLIRKGEDLLVKADKQVLSIDNVLKKHDLRVRKAEKSLDTPKKKITFKSSFFKIDSLKTNIFKTGDLTGRSKGLDKSDMTTAILFVGGVVGFRALSDIVANVAGGGGVVVLAVIVVAVLALYTGIMLKTADLVFKIQDSVALKREVKLAKMRKELENKVAPVKAPTTQDAVMLLAQQLEEKLTVEEHDQFLRVALKISDFIKSGGTYYLGTFDQESFKRIHANKLPETVGDYLQMTFTKEETKTLAQAAFKEHLQLIEDEADDLILRAEKGMLEAMDTRSRYLRQTQKSALDL